MIEEIEAVGNLFYVEISGQITKKEVEYAIPIVKKMIVEYKQVKSLIYLNNFRGYTIGGFIADFIFYIKYINVFKNIAIVGNDEKPKKLTNILNKIFFCNAKYFDISQFEEAKSWINQF